MHVEQLKKYTLMTTCGGNLCVSPSFPALMPAFLYGEPQFLVGHGTQRPSLPLQHLHGPTLPPPPPFPHHIFGSLSM